ncbi:MAG TPA: N-acetyltransferase, partial [Porphyromonadaceae bacterium]|nr:N-acetyltransferase [Porphyromonadaceae bacterium]
FELEDGVIDAYHTGVRPEFEGQGIAARLVDELASFAREHSYTIIPSCPYISAKFRRAPEKFNDLWHR